MTNTLKVDLTTRLSFYQQKHYQKSIDQRMFGLVIAISSWMANMRFKTDCFLKLFPCLKNIFEMEIFSRQ